ncbi:hypothetical protein B0H13DRAFT_1913254 [Mycena leptocephala]|nr:hypothetical protein B0H13DRAFT_1913254 [Mycena leptocephala]
MNLGLNLVSNARDPPKTRSPPPTRGRPARPDVAQLHLQLHGQLPPQPMEVSPHPIPFHKNPVLCLPESHGANINDRRESRSLQWEVPGAIDSARVQVERGQTSGCLRRTDQRAEGCLTDERTQRPILRLELSESRLRVGLRQCQSLHYSTILGANPPLPILASSFSGSGRPELEAKALHQGGYSTQCPAEQPFFNALHCVSESESI